MASRSVATALAMLVRGVLVVVVTVWASVFLATWLSGVLALFFAVIVGILGGLLVGRDGDVSGLIVAFLITDAGLGITAAILREHPPLGAAISGISVREAPAHPFVTRFRFVDGKVRDDLASSSAVRGKYGEVLYSQSVAPIVPDGWTPSDPVPAWAASKPHALRESEADWQQPYRAGARLVTGTLESGPTDAIDVAVRKHHLRSADGAPVLRWTADPEAMIADDTRTTWIIVAIGVALWTGATAWSAISRSARRERPGA